MVYSTVEVTFFIQWVWFIYSSEGDVKYSLQNVVEIQFSFEPYNFKYATPPYCCVAYLSVLPTVAEILSKENNWQNEQSTFLYKGTITGCFH